MSHAPTALSIFQAWSHGVCALAYAVLSILLLTSWKGRSIGVRLIVCALVTVVWAVQLTMQPLRPTSDTAIYIAEVLRTGAWLWFLSGLLRGTAPRFVTAATLTTWPVLLVVGLAMSTLQAVGVLSDATLAAFLPIVGLTLAFLGLVSVEQLYRNTPVEARRGLGLLVLAIGISFAYDLFLYSQTELLRLAKTEVWAVRGLLLAALTPMLAISVRRNPQWSLDVFVSRQVVFHTTSFLAVGLYLVLMALGGYYLRAVGGAWGAVVEVVFFAGAMFALATLLFSEVWRRRILVFISKHFYRNKYDYRLEWLRFIDTLARGDQDIVSTSIRAVAQLLESPSGMLYELDRAGGQYVVTGNWPRALQSESGFAAISLDEPIIHYLAQREWIIDLAEFRSAPDRYQGLTIPGFLMAEQGLRLISPVLDRDRLIGFFAIYEPAAPFELTFEDRDLLKTVGRHVATQLSQYRAHLELAEGRQFQTYHRFIAFTMHDLKNSVAQLNLIVKNAARHKANPEFVDDMVATVRSASDRIARLMEQLQTGEQRYVPCIADIDALLRSAIARCGARQPVPQLRSATESCRVTVDADRMIAAIEHVIRNAQDATSVDGIVLIESAHGESGQVRIVVSDNGSGMDMAFIRDRLFQPFDSTKGGRGMGIGAYQVRDYVQQAGGTVEVSSSPGIGTRFCITLPASMNEIDHAASAPASTAANSHAAEVT